MDERRWAAVEIMGHRQHVGVITEETFAGATLIRIDELRRDGSFESVRYGGAAIFSLRDVTEDAARKAVMSKDWMACSAYREPSAVAGLCSKCGYTREEHEAANARRLPERAAEDEDDDPLESALEAMADEKLAEEVRGG